MSRLFPYCMEKCGQRMEKIGGILMNTNIGMSFLDLSQEEKEEKINKIVPSICSVYCCRENCNGCFIQELTDETFKNKE